MRHRVAPRRATRSASRPGQLAQQGAAARLTYALLGFLFVLVAIALWAVWLVRNQRQYAVQVEASLRAQADQLNRRDAELEAQLDSLKRQEAKLQTQMQALSAREADLARTVRGIAQDGEELRKREDELETQVLRLAEQEDALEALVRSIQAREEALSARVQLLQESDAALGGQIEQHIAARKRWESDRQAWQQRESELLQKLEQRQASVERLRAELKQAQDELAQQHTRAGELQSTSDSLQTKITYLEKRVAELEADVPAPIAATHWSKMIAPISFEDLLKQAQRNLSGLYIPDSALQRPQELNSAQPRDAWLRSAWRALGILNDYATSDPPFQGDFYAWNQQEDLARRWPLDNIALRESGQTMGKFSKKRVFDVDHRLDASGKITMEAHLKVSSGSGQHIPRIFFHDDTNGETGQVHIGFIGPHHLAPVFSAH